MFFNADGTQSISDCLSLIRETFAKLQEDNSDIRPILWIEDIHMCDRGALMQILGLIIDIKLHGSFPVIMTVSEANSDFVTYVKQNGILLHSEALLLNVSCLMVLMLFFISLFFF